MDKAFTLEIEVVPRGWERVDARVQYRRGGGKPFVLFYEGREMREYKAQIADFARVLWGRREPLDGAISVMMDCIMPVPKSWSDAKWQRAVSGIIRPGVKPDWDNLGKAVSDACNKIVWIDDAQIVDGRVRKFYGKRPAIIMTVRETQIGLLEVEDAAA